MNEFMEKYATNKIYKILSIVIGIISAICLFLEYIFEENTQDAVNEYDMDAIASISNSFKEHGSSLKMYIIILFILTLLAIIIAAFNILKKNINLSYISGIILYVLLEYSILTSGSQLLSAYNDWSLSNKNIGEFIFMMMMIVVIYAICQLIALIVKFAKKKPISKYRL